MEIKINKGGLYYNKDTGGHYILCWCPRSTRDSYEDRYYMVYEKGNITTRGSLSEERMLEYLKEFEYKGQLINILKGVKNELQRTVWERI